MKPQYIEVEPSHKPCIVVVTDVAGMREVAESMDQPVRDPEQTCLGLMRDLGGNKYLVFICIEEIHDLVKLISVVAHEAVHVSQYYFEFIGEECPSAEFQAYMVGDITQEIFNAIRVGEPDYLTKLATRLECEEAEPKLEEAEPKLGEAEPKLEEAEPEDVIGDYIDVPDRGGITSSTTGPELIKRLLEE